MVALAFLKTNLRSNGQPEINLPIIIQVLSVREQEYQHDDAYDTLDLLDAKYQEDLPLLYWTLQDVKARSFARWYALRAILKIEGYTQGTASLSSSLLLDKDQHLRTLAIDSIKKCTTKDSAVAIPYIVQVIKDQDSRIDVKANAVTALIKIVGLRRAVQELQSHK